VYGRDLTPEGIAFVKAAQRSWFRSKAAAKDPRDTTLLENYLAKVRARQP